LEQAKQYPIRDYVSIATPGNLHGRMGTCGREGSSAGSQKGGKGVFVLFSSLPLSAAQQSSQLAYFRKDSTLNLDRLIWRAPEAYPNF